MTVSFKWNWRRDKILFRFVEILICYYSVFLQHKFSTVIGCYIQTYRIPIRRETYSIRQTPLTFHTQWMQRWSKLMNSSWARKGDGSSCKVRSNLHYRRINYTLASWGRGFDNWISLSFNLECSHGKILAQLYSEAMCQAQQTSKLST